MGSRPFQRYITHSCRSKGCKVMSFHVTILFSNLQLWSPLSYRNSTTPSWHTFCSRAWQHSRGMFCCVHIFLCSLMKYQPYTFEIILPIHVYLCPWTSFCSNTIDLVLAYVKNAQCIERILNKIVKALNETFTGLMYMLQEFRICSVWNHRLKGKESTC